MRVTTAFNRLLEIPGASVRSVAFERDGVVVGLRRRSKRLVCPRCGCLGRGSHGQRRRRWRHLDLGATRCYLECELRRFCCPGCEKVVTEAVPWARPGARFTRDLEDVVCWLAQQAAFSVIERLMRLSWRSVAAIVRRVVASELDRRRLRELYVIGVDEISYRRGQRYLTLVADHADGAVVWAGKGRGAATLARFLEELGEEEAKKLRAVSIDMSGSYQKALREHCAQATVCFDPFHVVALAKQGARRAAPGALAHARQEQRLRPLRQGHTLGAAQRPGHSDRAPAGDARLPRRGQLAALPRLPAQGAAASDLRARVQGAGRAPASGLAARSGALQAEAVREARAHAPPSQAGDPERDPARALEQPPRRTRKPHPTDHPPQLRLPLSRAADRAHPPLLRSDQGRATNINDRRPRSRR